MQLLVRPRLGIALALLGGLVISLDIPVIRLALSDPWTFMFFRGFGMSLILGAILVFGRNLTNTPPSPFRDNDFVAVGILYGLSSIFFTLAVFTTSTANLVFILALNPLIAALMAWLLIGEKPGWATWVAIVATIIGVAIIVVDGVESGTTHGDVFAFMTAVMLGYTIVRTRKSGKDMSLAGSLGGLITGLFALPIMLAAGRIPGNISWLLLNAFLMAPVGAFALSLAPRFIPAPQVAMFFLLETVLAPIWVWLIFSEQPSNMAMLGGFIVLIAIAFHSIVQLKRGDRNREAPSG